MTERSPGRAFAQPANVIAIYVFGYGLIVNYVLFFASGLSHRPDYAVYWAASHFLRTDPSLIYDPVAITTHLSFLAPVEWGLVPWVYPPPALFFAAPLGELSLWTGFAIWTLLGSVLLIGTLMRICEWRSSIIALVLFSYPCVLGIYTGQVMLFTVAAGFAIVLWLDRRPIAVGVLIAIAGLIKPSMFILAPVALAAGGHWRTFFTAACATILLVAASLVVFGPERWFDWLDGIAVFVDMHARQNTLKQVPTFNVMLIMLDLPETVRLILRVVAGMAAVTACWMIFRHRQDSGSRLMGLFGATFLISPYAMGYDVVIILPVAAWLLIREKHGWGDWLIGLLAAPAFLTLPGVAPFVVPLFVMATLVALACGRLPDPLPVRLRKGRTANRPELSG